MLTGGQILFLPLYDPFPMTLVHSSLPIPSDCFPRYQWRPPLPPFFTTSSQRSFTQTCLPLPAGSFAFPMRVVRPDALDRTYQRCRNMLLMSLVAEPLSPTALFQESLSDVGIDPQSGPPCEVIPTTGESAPPRRRSVRLASSSFLRGSSPIVECADCPTD